MKQQRKRSQRSRACDISTKVRNEVLDRDSHNCIFCHANTFLTIAHYLPRSKGGLGIKENLTTACWNCHMELDQGTNRTMYRDMQKAYLDALYPNFTDEERKYHKWKRSNCME